MALVLADRVKETTTTTGTGDISLGGAETNFVAFGTALSDADTTYYAIVDDVNSDFEIGIGTYTSGTDTLSRDTILDSTNAGLAVNFGVGVKSIFITYPADKALRVGSDISDLTNDSGFITSATSISTTAPVSPSTGDLWWNSESGQLKVYYTDADSSQWVDAAASAANPSIAINDLTDVNITSATTGNFLQYDGTEWVNTAGDLNTTATVQGSDGTSDWSQASGSDPWIATKTVSGLLSTDRPIVDIDLSSVAYADVVTVQAAWATVYRVEASADNELKVYATAEPAPNFALLITVVR